MPLYFLLLFTNWLPDSAVVLRFRGFLVSPFLHKCGKNFRIGRNVTLYNPSKIEVGNDVYIAKGNWFSALGKIEIEDSVMFGPYSVIASGNHSMKNGSYRYGDHIAKPIHIGAGTWITSHCTITAGSYIGKSCLIIPNTTVKGSVPDHSTYGGQQGSVIKIEEK
jgi:acetyltransferase-like isoleucine patch superfamily enzyme